MDEERYMEAGRQENMPPRSRREAPRRGGGWMGKAALVISVLALAVSAAALSLTLLGRGEEAAPPTEPETFPYRDRLLTVLEGVPVNGYDPVHFGMDERGRVTYQRDGVQAKTGVDVSFYQKEIDWQAVAADGIDFAIIRVGYRGYTEGGLILDKCFEQNIQGALDAGLEVGVYFFSQAISPEEAREEAAYVLEQLEGYEVTYPVVFDWEYITSGEGARTEGMDGETLTQCALAFCKEIRQGGYEPMVYFNQDMGYLTYDLREFTDLALWLAEYDERPDFYYHFDLWQYTHTGTVAGIEGNVDLNLDLR